jgi:hypothetical protein
VRRLVLKGWSVHAIARLYRLDRSEVRGMLSCPLPPPPRPPDPAKIYPAKISLPARAPRPGPDPLRRILGPLASQIKLRYLAGEPAETIAEALHLDPARVRSFLARAFPPGRPPRERSPRRKDPPRWPDWHPSNGPEYREATGLLPVAGDFDNIQIDQVEAPRPAETETERLNRFSLPPATPADWGPRNAPRPGALDADQVVRLRHWKSRGVPLAELARWFDCSVATVKRALRPDYRPAPSPATPRPMPPQVAAAELSDMIRWPRSDDE